MSHCKHFTLLIDILISSVARNVSLGNICKFLIWIERQLFSENHFYKYRHPCTRIGNNWLMFVCLIVCLFLQPLNCWSQELTFSVQIYLYNILGQVWVSRSLSQGNMNKIQHFTWICLSCLYSIEVSQEAKVIWRSWLLYDKVIYHIKVKWQKDQFSVYLRCFMIYVSFIRHAFHWKVLLFSLLFFSSLYSYYI